MLADDSIDAVYNPLPNSRHAELTIMALQAGKQCAIPTSFSPWRELTQRGRARSVLCEKPFTNNAAEAIAVQRASEDSGCIAVEAMHPLLHPVAKRARAIVLGGEIGTLEHIDVQFMANFAGYDEGVRSKMHDPTPMFEDQRFDSNLGGGAMMDLGCYCISALRNLSAEEPTCTSATPDVWSEPPPAPALAPRACPLPRATSRHIPSPLTEGVLCGQV